MRRYIYIVFGIISLIIGIIGITVPGLPTTPFILLSAWLFGRSSEFLLRKMMSIKIVSKYVNNYQRKRGMSVKKKILTILFMWAMVSLSVIFHIDSMTIKHIIIGNAFIGTVVMGFVVPTAK